MLERVDIDRIFTVARHHGYRCELYAEQSHHCALDIQSLSIRTEHGGTHESRIEGLRISRSGGAALRLSRGNTIRHLASNAITTESLLALLEGKPNETPTGDSPPLFIADPPSPEADPLKTLSALVRASLGQESEGLYRPRVEFRNTIRRFEVVRPDGQRNQGRDETASVLAQWAIEKEGTRSPFRAEWWGDSAARLIRSLESSQALAREVAASRSRANPWPCPQGQLPVLWSPRAMAKLISHLLRGFEGDRVLGNLSFLNSVTLPLELPFSLADRPDTETSACDLEGTLRRTIPIFHEGRPRALACNNEIAEQLSVPSTGHCRRESRHASPTVGFWNPVLEPLRPVKGLLSQMEKGICVDDLEVKAFDPRTGAISLRLESATLVHHGARGEAIGASELELNLLSLLSGLSGFDSESETHGIASVKGDQRFLTSVTTPAAVSPDIEIAGEVPSTHYW